MKEKIALVWFKKDLRVKDHAPLDLAMKQWFHVVGLYCFEPSIMNQPDRSCFHGQFIKESLIDLKQELDALHIPLLVLKDEFLSSVNLLRKELSITWIYAHEETGNQATYARDLKVHAGLRSHKIPFHEFPTNGVVRRLSDRDAWQWIWKERMQTPIIEVPSAQDPFLLPESISKASLKLSSKRTYSLLQHWWLSHANKTLEAFLQQSNSLYTYHVWRPHESTKSCSRLSPYLSYGTLSLKQIYHPTNWKRTSLTELRAQHKKWTKEWQKIARSIRQVDAFTSRLHWHCHFIQKLESEVAYETQNIHPYYDRIRNKDNKDLLEAWKDGRTWYPLIDAAMRCLRSTGRINFRLRATVVSFICNTCMQHRKEPALHLAKLFLDYEPWIHYPQFQMQAGTTGINQYRIYNPTKQLLEKDDTWTFIDTRIPELRQVPMPLKAEPRKLKWSLFGNEYGVEIWVDYPLPIVDLEEANRKARTILRDLKKSKGFREIAAEIYQRHGSRRR